jgi:hypothetical protein
LNSLAHKKLGKAVLKKEGIELPKELGWIHWQDPIRTLLSATSYTRTGHFSWRLNSSETIIPQGV